MCGEIILMGNCLPHNTVSNLNPTLTGLGENTGLRGRKPAINRWCYRIHIQFCMKYSSCYFNVSLNVHLNVTLANDQLDAQIFNLFITILYMFRAISCSSSGGQIVLIQHPVSSLSVSDSLVHRTVTYCD